MRRNKHLLLWSSLTSLALLVVAAADENLFKDWRRLQATVGETGGGIDVRLRQIVVPALRVTDRCVTCHVGMASGEPTAPAHPVLRPHPPVVHDPAQFGCTLCHGGQGRATDIDEAHGRAPFWPSPMLPRRASYAGCGTCHTHLQVPSLAALSAGSAAFERHDCLACHRLDGRGGTLRPDGHGMEGPDLSLVGATGYRPDWYSTHLTRQRAASSAAWAASFAQVADPDREAIEVFLRSRVGAPGLVEGKALFQSLGCRGCHRVGGVGGEDGPDLTAVGNKDPGRLDFTHVSGERTLGNWFAEHFRSPQRLVPGSLMPVLGLTDEQIDRVTFYMLSLRRGEIPEAYWPVDRIRAERFGEREFAVDGATLWGAFCAACHGPSGEGMRYPGMFAFPAVANPDFLSLVSDDFLKAAVTRGRPGRRMAAWGQSPAGLRPDEIDAVVSHLRTLGGVAPEPDPRPARWVTGDAAAGGPLFDSHCARCHGPHGEGGEGPALRNPVLLETATDTMLVETIRRGRRGTTMEGFMTATPTRPALAQSDIESIVAFLRAKREGS